MPQNRDGHTKVKQFRLSDLSRDRLATIAAHHDTTEADVIRMLIGQEHERISRLVAKEKNPEKSRAGA